jgi:predicted membrane protein (TIGR00267 family)
MIKRLRNFFQIVRRYLQITQMTPIARRYFIKNGFDGSMTVLGIVVGAWIVRVSQPEIIVTAGLGACLAMGVSGLFGAYMTEKAERKQHLKTVENAMLTDLSDSVLSDASNFVSLYAAFIDGASPVLTAMIALIPFILALGGTFAIWDAYIVSLILALGTLFSLGLYLGRIAKENMLLFGVQTVAAGILIVVIVLLLGAI